MHKVHVTFTNGISNVYVTGFVGNNAGVVKGGAEEKPVKKNETVTFFIFIQHGEGPF